MDTLFISAAATDAVVAQSVARVLESAGYGVILPLRQFADKDFIAQRQAALEMSPRVILLLSPEFLADDLCTAEWQSVLAADPLDTRNRIVVLRIAACTPPVPLTRLLSWDLVPASADPAAFENVVLQAVRTGSAGVPADGNTGHVPAAVESHERAEAASVRPTGTITFVFTDIADSAQRWERAPDAMAAALRRHDVLVRTALAEQRGFVFETAGEAIAAAFARPEDAIRAAVMLAVRAAAEDFSAVGGLPVRVAIHTGTADQRSDDYAGPAVERAAQLLRRAGGGQILVSGATAELVRGRLPAQADLLDLGEHRLEGLDRPERIFRVTAPELPSAASSVGFESERSHLPSVLTSFVGRQAEVAEIVRLTRAQRLVTIVGAGGIGKTRIALAAAAALADTPADGVWFVDFAPLGSGRDVVPEIASVLGVKDGRDVPLLASVVAHLKAKRLLLVLDNCEHVIDEARTVVEALVRSCPGVTILATSRELLAAGGEVAYRLPTLAVPPDTPGLTAAGALEYGAVALFAARAQAADARFVLRDTNAAAIGEICRRLDGIALAIELAAARVAVLGVATVAAKLGERFRLLTGGSRTALPRQQTLRALIDWSYDLLDRDGQRLFRRLSVFAGGWTLEAATAICGDADADEFTILDGLTSLADKSLVTVEVLGDANRFGFLESMRAYALERAQKEGEIDELARRRTEFFLKFAGDGTTVAADVVARIAAIEAEVENLREILRWTLEAGHDVEGGARLACALGRFWSTRLPREGLRWLELARSLLDERAGLDLQADIANAIAAMLPHGSAERFAATERALQVNREAGEPRKLSKALAAYGEQLYPLGRQGEAQAAFEESLEAARRVGSDWDAGRALAGLTMIAVAREDIPLARDLGQQAISLFDSIDAIDGVAYVSVALAEAEFETGNVERALELARRARAAYGAVKNDRSSAGAAVFLAALSFAAGKPDDGRTHARDALAVLGTDRHPMFFNSAIGHLAHAATAGGDLERGARLFGYYQAAQQKITHAIDGCERQCYEQHLRSLIDALSAEELERRMALGAQLSDDGALEEALRV